MSAENSRQTGCRWEEAEKQFLARRVLCGTDGSPSVTFDYIDRCVSLLLGIPLFITAYRFVEALRDPLLHIN